MGVTHSENEDRYDEKNVCVKGYANKIMPGIKKD